MIVTQLAHDRAIENFVIIWAFCMAQSFYFHLRSTSYLICIALLLTFDEFDADSLGIRNDRANIAHRICK